MNYNTNRTIQAVCAKAIIMQTAYCGSSCGAIAMGAVQDWLGFQVRYSIKEDYRLFSDARVDSYGFHHISQEDWSLLSDDEYQTYRLEMLYYFWLANQDGMDAFS
jgi:hypothetical protein